MSHDINSDPEVWELTDQFGDRGLRAWLECLSIADRNEGFIPGDRSQIERALSIKLNTFQVRTKLILSWFLDRSWLVQDPDLRVRNYSTYKPTREAKKNETGSPPNPPIRDSHPKNAEPGSPAPSADPKSKESRKLDAAIKDVADPIYQSDRQKFDRLIVWIKDKQKRDYPNEVITTTLRLYWEHEQKSKVADWWPYINRIFTKEYGRWNEAQAAKHKAEDSAFVRKLVTATAGVMKI